MVDIPDRLPTALTDRLLFSQRRLVSGCGHIVIHFLGRLDADRLRDAVHLVADEQPVLGCRFVYNRFVPYWERWPDLAEVPLFHLSAPDVDADADLESFLQADHDPETDPQFAVRLIRGQTDKICLRFNHMAGDLTAGAQTLGRVAATYRSLRSNPAYRPTPNLADRSMRPLARQWGWQGRWMILKNMCKHFRRLARCGKWNLPEPKPMDSTHDSKIQKRAGTCVYVVPQERLQEIQRYARRSLVSVNLTLAGAFFRAVASMNDQPLDRTLPLGMSIDARQFLKRSDPWPICNQLGISMLYGEHTASSSLESMLEQFRTQIKQRRRSCLDVVSLAFVLETFPVLSLLARWTPFSLLDGMHSLASRRVKKKQTPLPAVSMGELYPQDLQFDDLEIDCMYTIPGDYVVPPLFLGATRFGNRASLVIPHQWHQVLERTLEILP